MQKVKSESAYFPRSNVWVCVCSLGHDSGADQVVEAGLLVVVVAVLAVEALHDVPDGVLVDELVRELGAQQQLAAVGGHGRLVAGRHLQPVARQLDHVAEVEVGAVLAHLLVVALQQTPVNTHSLDQTQ